MSAILNHLEEGDTRQYQNDIASFLQALNELVGVDLTAAKVANAIVDLSHDQHSVLKKWVPQKFQNNINFTNVEHVHFYGNIVLLYGALKALERDAILLVMNKNNITDVLLYAINDDIKRTMNDLEVREFMKRPHAIILSTFNKHLTAYTVGKGASQDDAIVISDEEDVDAGEREDAGTSRDEAIVNDEDADFMMHVPAASVEETFDTQTALVQLQTFVEENYQRVRNAAKGDCSLASVFQSHNNHSKQPTKSEVQTMRENAVDAIPQLTKNEFISLKSMADITEGICKKYEIPYQTFINAAKRQSRAMTREEFFTLKGAAANQEQYEKYTTLVKKSAQEVPAEMAFFRTVKAYESNDHKHVEFTMFMYCMLKSLNYNAIVLTFHGDTLNKVTAYDTEQERYIGSVMGKLRSKADDYVKELLSRDDTVLLHYNGTDHYEGYVKKAVRQNAGKRKPNFRGLLPSSDDGDDGPVVDLGSLLDRVNRLVTLRAAK